jgi:hypothetical protein
MSDGEEWKGEDETPKLSFSLFGWGHNLTPEEVDAAQKSLAERRAKGRLLASTLTRFREDAKCGKCGSPKSRTSYCSAAGAHGLCLDHCGDVPHLHRDCKRCGFTWYELPLDAEDA